MEIISAIRDIVISVYAIVGIVLTLTLLIFTFLLFGAVKGLIGIGIRTAENFEKVSSSAVKHIAKPLEEGVSFGSVAGNAVGFATGFVAGIRKQGDQGKDEGGVEREGKKRKKRWIPFR
jgi:hypothetical protein